MTKRLIDIDDELLASAREHSDADTIRGTVEQALRTLVRIEATRRHIDELRDSLEPNSAELLDQVRSIDVATGDLPH